MERVYTDDTYIALLLVGTQFNLIFAPEGTPTNDNYETWTNCTILSCEHTAGEDGALLEKLNGEGIGMRLGMLSGSINTASYNNALQVLAPAYGVMYFKMSGSQP
jgi:hypothetical protein